MTKTRRGEVVLVLFPNSDLRTAKRRPALVVQRSNLDSGLAQTIIAMISSNLARRGHPSRVFVGVNSAAGKTAGLRLDSVIMADNLATDSSSPTVNSRKATPNAAMPATFAASLIVNQPTKETDLPSEPSPRGPNTAPAAR